MGVSTDGIICFGVHVGEELPEAMDGLGGDEEEWWLSHNSYNPPFEMFTEDGDWIGGKKWSDEKVSEYYDHRRAWLKQNPIPFEMINCCSDDCPDWIIAVHGASVWCHRGYPKEIRKHTVSEEGHEDAIKMLKAFLEEIGCDGELKWWLASYWG